MFFFSLHISSDRHFQTTYVVSARHGPKRTINTLKRGSPIHVFHGLERTVLGRHVDPSMELRINHIVGNHRSRLQRNRTETMLLHLFAVVRAGKVLHSCCLLGRKSHGPASCYYTCRDTRGARSIIGSSTSLPNSRAQKHTSSPVTTNGGNRKLVGWVFSSGDFPPQ